MRAHLAIIELAVDVVGTECPTVLSERELAEVTTGGLANLTCCCSRVLTVVVAVVAVFAGAVLGDLRYGWAVWTRGRFGRLIGIELLPAGLVL